MIALETQTKLLIMKSMYSVEGCVCFESMYTLLRRNDIGADIHYIAVEDQFESCWVSCCLFI